ncbi:MAG TPA: hypothetical protein VJZ68_04350 [Nitrososphaera sp.]|nr:hypothetical protein [Nitrososphaera sp.]
MIVNVIHPSLNARGGGERLAVATITALTSMGIDVELTIVEKPDMALIRDAYGTSMDSYVKKNHTLGLFQSQSSSSLGVTTNTQGDILPFFRRYFTKKSVITYCDYPIAGHLIDCGDSDYAGVLQNMCLSSMASKCRDVYFKPARSAYEKMMANSTVLSNWEFSRRAFFKTFGVDSKVLHPPVDVDAFRNASLSSDSRDNSILVTSRFHPSKRSLAAA